MHQSLALVDMVESVQMIFVLKKHESNEYGRNIKFYVQYSQHIPHSLQIGRATTQTPRVALQLDCQVSGIQAEWSSYVQ